LFELYSQYPSTRPPISVFLKKFSVTLSGSGGGGFWSAGLSYAPAWRTVARLDTALRRRRIEMDLLPVEAKQDERHARVATAEAEKSNFE